MMEPTTFYALPAYHRFRKKHSDKRLGTRLEAVELAYECPGLCNKLQGGTNQLPGIPNHRSVHSLLDQQTTTLPNHAHAAEWSSF